MKDKEKELILRVILSYLFNDNDSIIVMQHNEFKVEFVRPLRNVAHRHMLMWNSMGDFEIYKICSKDRLERLTHFSSSNWMKVGSYIRSNHIKCKNKILVTL